jgi:small subunit ribosomal protein S21
MNTRKVTVEVRNGDIARALKTFKRKVMDVGHLQELRDRKEYTKPKTVRRKQKQKAIRMEKLRNLNDPDKN